MSGIFNLFKQRIYNVIFNVFLVVWTAVYLTVLLPSLILPHYLIVEVRIIWINVILFFIRVLFDVEIEITGKENFHKYKNYIVASKHHSPLDVLLVAKIVEKPAFILKKSLLYIPIFGMYIIATKMITITYSTRSNGVDVLRKMIRQAKVLVKNRTLVIYPEGERTKVGHKVKYKRGILSLYKHLNLPVVPIALNAGQIWPMGYFDAKKSGKVVIQILEPIEPGLTADEFTALLEHKIESATERLLEINNNQSV